MTPLAMCLIGLTTPPKPVVVKGRRSHIMAGSAAKPTTDRALTIDERRDEIVRILGDRHAGPRTIQQLVEILDVGETAIANDLAVLQEAGRVLHSRFGMYRVYWVPTQ